MSRTMEEEGGPAFPLTRKMAEHHIGMTLRDYYAIHASDGDIDAVLDAKGKVGFPVWRSQARYIFADAMIRARGMQGRSLYEDKAEAVE